MRRKKRTLGNRARYMTMIIPNMSSKEIHDKNVRSCGFGLFEGIDDMVAHKTKELYMCGSKDVIKFLENKLNRNDEEVFIYADSSSDCSIQKTSIILETKNYLTLGHIPDIGINKPIQTGRPYFIDDKNRIYVFAVKDGVGNIVKLYTGLKYLSKEKIDESLAIRAVLQEDTEYEYKEIKL